MLKDEVYSNAPQIEDDLGESVYKLNILDVMFSVIQNHF
jgi:hypothetical protein